MPVTLGSEQLIRSDALHGARVGIVCNPASIDAAFRHVADRLADAADVTLAAIFGPQHGYRADVQDNMIETPHARDARRQVPVYSLYSDTREPTAAMLDGLDALVIDLQDVGTRGELARLFNEHFGIGAALEVIPMEGWQRSMYHDTTGLPWVLPSPNLPTLESAIVYPGMVLLEGTNLSEGRGTTRPFEIFGAPWIDADALAGRLNETGLPGAHFRPVVFAPTFQKHVRQACGGCQVHVTDRGAFRPVETAVTLLAAVRQEPPYEYEAVKMPIDILYGSDRLRRGLEDGRAATEIAAGWTAEVKEFRKLREAVLLY